ncbi:MAG: hypothetical protein L6R30_27190 [Thermoanaerobaculia bacterium]|nr:hypothetical protein [Thermoanaerobaculia bacterium]
MQTLPVVELEVAANLLPCVAGVSYPFTSTSSYLTVRQNLSAKTLSSARPRPFMLMTIPEDFRTEVNGSLVNCTPRQVQKMTGLPSRSTHSGADTQNSLSIVDHISNAST